MQVAPHSIHNLEDIQMTTTDTNEYKTVVVHHDSDDSQSPHLIIKVDGKHYSILRGQATRLRLTAYEALVATKEAYPFTLVQAFGPGGRIIGSCAYPESLDTA